MNPLDWLLAILLTYSVVRAALRGFFQEAFALGGLVLGFLLACWMYQDAAKRLAGLIASPQLAQLAAFLLILAATMVVGSLLGKLLRRTASVIGLGFMDRLLGVLFGLVRGALLGVVILSCLVAFLPAGQWVQSSKLAPYFLRAAHAVSFVMPSDLKHRLFEGLDRIKHTSHDWIKHGMLSHTGNVQANLIQGRLHN
jgi:membrane protein required for colicin V production